MAAPAEAMAASMAAAVAAVEALGIVSSIKEGQVSQGSIRAPGGDRGTAARRLKPTLEGRLGASTSSSYEVAECVDVDGDGSGDTTTFNSDVDLSDQVEGGGPLFEGHLFEATNSSSLSADIVSTTPNATSHFPPHEQSRLLVPWNRNLANLEQPLVESSSARAQLEKERLGRVVSDTRSFELNGLVGKVADLRAQRLSHESFPLPALHFVILGFLSGLVALCFAMLAPTSVAEVVRTRRGVAVAAKGWPSHAGFAGQFATPRCLFALLVSCLALVLDFSKDLNQPFTGFYQVKRAVPTSILLQVRKAILDTLPEKEREALVASGELSLRLAAFKQRKYPVAASLLGSDQGVRPDLGGGVA